MPQNDSDLVWATEVLDVYRCLGDASSETGLKTTSSKKLYEWASNETNQDKFFSSIVPKATEFLQKHRENQRPDAMDQFESRGVAELRKILLEEMEKSRMTPVI